MKKGNSLKRAPANERPLHSVQALPVPIRDSSPLEQASHVRRLRGATAARPLRLDRSSPASCRGCTERLRCPDAVAALVHRPLLLLPYGPSSGLALLVLRRDRDSSAPSESRPHTLQLTSRALLLPQRSPPVSCAVKQNLDQACTAFCTPPRQAADAHERCSTRLPCSLDRARWPGPAIRQPPAGVLCPTE